MKPTPSPSSRPSTAPTFMPTFSKAFLLKQKLQRYLSTNLTQDGSSTSTVNVLYQETVVAGGSPDVGGCNSWRVATGSGLSTMTVTKVATSLTLYAYDDNRCVGLVPCTVADPSSNPTFEIYISHHPTLVCPSAYLPIHLLTRPIYTSVLMLRSNRSTCLL
jgi:hypothetical protein